MGRFAHFGDCHLGAWRDLKLRKLNLDSFIFALDECVERKVDFIIISGDLFDTPLPDLSLVQKAVEKIREAKEKGIVFYLTYGSHDFAANSISIIDILQSTGLFKKVAVGYVEDEKIHLNFTVDSKTGAKIVGLSGRRLGLEKKYFEMLDSDKLEFESGFKIFVFHNAILELRSPVAMYGEGIPISSFPKGFNYYAGGHVHENLQHTFDEHGLVVFPGCLFGSTFTDLELTARGEKRGIYIVDFDEKINDVQFVEIGNAQVFFKEFNVDKKTASQVSELLFDFVEQVQVKNKIVLLKVFGELSSGKASDVVFSEIRRALYRKEALVVNINHYNVSSQERQKSLKILGNSRQEIEQNIFSQVINSFKIDSALKDELKVKLEKSLTSNGGLSLANDLLYSLKTEKQEGETRRDFEQRILKNTLHFLNLELKS